MATHRGFRIVKGKVDLTKSMVSTSYRGIQVLRRLSDKKGSVRTKKTREMRVLFSHLSTRFSKALTKDKKNDWDFRVHFRRPYPSKIAQTMSSRWPGSLRRQKQLEYYGSGIDLYVASNIIAYKSDMNIPRDIAPSVSVSRPIQPLPKDWRYENGEIIILAEIPEQDSFYKEMVLRATAQFWGGRAYIRNKDGKVKKAIRRRINQQIAAIKRLDKCPCKTEIRISALDGGRVFDYKRIPLKELGTGIIKFNLDIVGVEGPDVGPLVSLSSDTCSIRINEDIEKALKISNKFFEKFNKGRMG